MAGYLLHGGLGLLGHVLMGVADPWGVLVLGDSAQLGGSDGGGVGRPGSHGLSCRGQKIRKKMGPLTLFYFSSRNKKTHPLDEGDSELALT